MNISLLIGSFDEKYERLNSSFILSPLFSVDARQLQALKKASSLVEAPNIDTKPKEEDLKYIFKNIADIKERNAHIVRAYKQGYSQHMIAKVLELNQATVQRIIKRTDDSISIT